MSKVKVNDKKNKHITTTKCRLDIEYNRICTHLLIILNKANFQRYILTIQSPEKT